MHIYLVLAALSLSVLLPAIPILRQVHTLLPPTPTIVLFHFCMLYISAKHALHFLLLPRYTLHAVSLKLWEHCSGQLCRRKRLLVEFLWQDSFQIRTTPSPNAKELVNI